jgi:predicted nucleic acid-binding Zn ribbon protein
MRKGVSAPPRITQPIYASRMHLLDLSGDFPVVHWHNGSKICRAKIRTERILSKHRPRGASLLVSRVYFRNCAECDKPITARFPFERFCSEGCRIENKRKRALAKPAPLRQCKGCPKHFEVRSATRGSPGKYCSERCCKRYWRLRKLAIVELRDKIERRVREMIDQPTTRRKTS